MVNQVRLALHSRDPLARTVGKLCVGGDWACAHGDLEALGDVASRLVRCTPEPLHKDLAGLCALCSADPDQASAAWVRLKNRVLQTLPRAS
ncbi:MAG TPA: hypothetical protein VGD37_13920 [Kofleriaceae bacterium]|jgi:hypothetical protein